ncbi:MULTISPECIES: DUF1996 domain-containing protein [unclassified Streptomyces]|uniref:DUF1996 domain-containing protein n=1 Tax=unclassified Streptomyces TaxID=2593676 RepID=UPI00225745C9|nr:MULTISPECIES: DUF1996 domain-containing protein [unclassified Streptomyces]MCX5285034.1 DUF1996 domain-containing protein [Streptomyces sp. NBC_00198]
MARRSKIVSGILMSSALVLTTLGLAGVAMSADPASGAATSVAGSATVHTGHAMPASTLASPEDPDGDGYIPANPPVTGVVPSKAEPTHRYFHEFQANCSVSHTRPDDPIVYPGQPGKSHDHTFMGNTTTNAASTTASLDSGGTTCKAPGDKSAYWMPTLLNGSTPVLPVGPQVIYYKAGVTDYTSVRPFPKGLRFVVGSPLQSAADFRNHRGFVEGWECGDSFFNVDFPAQCPNRADVQLNIRFQAPSCWDGKYLDTPNHQSHMAYPVVNPGTNNNICPDDHPVALPMIEFKMAFPVNGDMSKVKLASGAGYSFHYDFFNAWDAPTLKALVDHCVVGGLQCDARGYDQTHPEAGAALDANYRLP